MRAIDLFAGWGGFTAGAESAGARVVWAANHWELAVRAHAANHPRTRHACQDLRQADWTALPRFDLMLASPCCQGHSTASQPRRRRYHDESRATAWAVADCADVTQPAALVVENTLGFRRWRLYGLWCEVLERLGYQLTEQVVRATAAGVPQRRDRIFIVGIHRRTRRGPLPLRMPEPRREPAFGPCLERGRFDWTRVADASASVQARIAKGRRNCGRRFLSQHVTGHPGVPLSEPIRTITGQDHWILVDGDRYRPLSIRENARGMGFADTYAWPTDATRRDAIIGLGNAVCPPVAAAIVRQIGDHL